MTYLKIARLAKKSTINFNAFSECSSKSYFFEYSHSAKNAWDI